MIINIIRRIEKGFKILTINFETLGKQNCRKVPIANGTVRTTADFVICEYGTAIEPLSKINIPKENAQHGIITANKITQAMSYKHGYK